MPVSTEDGLRLALDRTTIRNAKEQAAETLDMIRSRADHDRNLYFLGLILAMVLGLVIAMAGWWFRRDRLALRSSRLVTIGPAVIGSLLLVLLLGPVWLKFKLWRDQRNAIPLAYQPFELKKRPTPEVIQAGLSKPEAPWAWQELQARLNTGDFTQAEANQLMTGFTTWLRQDYPHGYDQPLDWMGTLLDDLKARQLVTETNALTLLDAYAGSPWLDALPRLREQEPTLQITCHIHNPWNDQLFGFKLLNKVRGVTIDGQPVPDDGAFGRGWAQQDYESDLKLPKLGPGKHVLTCEVQSDWVDATNLTGLAPSAPASDWPPARVHRITQCSEEFMVYSPATPPVSLSDDPALDPVAAGCLVLKQVLIRARGGKLTAILSFEGKPKSALPRSVDVSLRIAGRVVVCGNIWALQSPNGRTLNGGSVQSTLAGNIVVNQNTNGTTIHGGDWEGMTAETGPLAPQIRSADIILTPNPQAVESQPGIERIWGREMVITNVPLTRLDLSQSSSGTNPPITFIFQSGRLVRTNQIGSNQVAYSFKSRSMALGDGHWSNLDGTSVLIALVKPDDVRVAGGE